MDKKIKLAYDTALPFLGQGKVADYIPELAKSDPRKLGIALTDIDGNVFAQGDSNFPFTIQSISKVISLALALEENGAENVFQKVNYSSTETAFNSIVGMEERADKRPINPMVNAGAIAVCSTIRGRSPQDRFEKIVDLTKKMTGSKDIVLDEKVYLSESSTGDRNRSLAYMMKSNGIISGEVEEHLEVYFKACSMLVTAENLSYLGAVLANAGRDVKTGEVIIMPETASIIRTIMAIGGMYNDSGAFAFHVGIPAKSGVGGGIMSAVRGVAGIGVYSPALDASGNSLAGIEAIKTLSKSLELSIY